MGVIWHRVLRRISQARNLAFPVGLSNHLHEFGFEIRRNSNSISTWNDCKRRVQRSFSRYSPAFLRQAYAMHSFSKSE